MFALLQLALILANLNDTQGMAKNYFHYISQSFMEVQPKD